MQWANALPAIRKLLRKRKNAFLRRRNGGGVASCGGRQTNKQKEDRAKALSFFCAGG
jgi:hypothetical protein